MKKKYRIEWKHNFQWRMEENNEGTFDTLVQANNARHQYPYDKVETRVTEFEQ